MSRPPIHRPVPSPRGDARYFAPDFAALVDLAETLARERHGIEIPARGRGLARTLIEMPALLAHVLGEHQGLYGREAHLGTAELAETLVRHALRLAHTPDPGVAATGLAAFTVKPGLRGTLAAGFALQSQPLGEAKAETYETLADLTLDAGWNAILPIEAETDDPVRAVAGLLVVTAAERPGLDPGEIVLLEGRGQLGLFRIADPAEGDDPLTLRLRHLGGHGYDEAPGAGHWDAGYRLHARPATEARLFGWNAPPTLWPAEALAQAVSIDREKAGETAGDVVFGYEEPGDLSSVLMLADPVPPPPVDAPVALVWPGAGLALRLVQADEVTAIFVRIETVTRPTVATPVEDGRTVVKITQEQTEIATRLAGRVLALTLARPDGGTRRWKTWPLDARFLAGWSKRIALARRRPNPAPLEPAFAVAADLTGMRPGRPAILRHRTTGAVHEATVGAIDREAEGWRLRLEVAGGFPSGWTLGTAEVLANVARISHGETRAEILGGSDGVSPHQGFALKGAPVTRLPAALGPAMALEVRVDGVLWDGAADFHAAGPGARIYTTATDAEGRVTLRFGGEGRGAIPPLGRRNVTALYREGLGVRGNAGEGRVKRIRKASPLIAEVTNPLPLRGGADPAGAADIARQATRPVRVFDRAVSVADHADLALLYPGIVRAGARLIDGAGIELVAADAEGNGPADRAAFLGFLDARRDTGLPLVLADPLAVPVRLSVRIERDRAYLAEAVRLAVEEALIGPRGLFTFAGRNLGQRQALSDLLARLRVLPGVAGLVPRHFGLVGATPAVAGPDLAEILHVTGRQWLSLGAADLWIDMVEPGLLHRATTGGMA